MSLERPLTGFRFVEIRHGDTLQTLAARELKDASKWPLLVTINDLAPPYITGDTAEAGEQVKLYGQLIAVPSAVAQVSADVDPDRVFGVDLDLTGGILRADNGDLQLIAGHRNLHQAIVHRITTPLGELLFHQLYGCGVWSLKGGHNGPTSGLLASQYVKGAMLSDKRIDAVERTLAEVVGDSISVSAKVQPVAGALIDISTEI